MGESACLLRSFSHPSSASREAKEGNPLRALTESISFGRFMSESLAWEKWSAFSHNRYLEEVEQFSKPGSVAQKKAYFEAHYKKRAAMKAAALLEQANAASNVPQVEAPGEAPNSSHVNSEIPKETNDVIINEQDEGSADAGLIQSSDANEFYADEQKDNLQNVKVEGNEVVREKNAEMENSIQVQNVKENENAEDSDITVAMPEEKMPNKVSCHSDQVAAEEENVTLPSKERQSKSSSQSRASILPRSSARLSSSARLRAETNDTPNNTSKRSLRVSKDRSTTEIPTRVANAKQTENVEDCDTANKVSCHSKQVTAEEENVTLPSNKRQMSSSSKLSIQNRATKLPKSSAKLSSSTRLRAETNDTPNITQKSIHMSINFASRLQDNNKSSLRVSQYRSATPEIPTKGSVYGVSKFLPSDRRTKSELNKSVSGKITAGGISQTLSSDCSKSSSAKGSRSRPPLISSPFSFRSDERAAKRKEFFEKLGEKNNAKEDTEKKHLQARPKEKAEYDLKKLRQSAVFRGKPREDLHGGLRSPENSTKKIPLARPRSPKLGRTSTSNVAREASLQLHRPSVNAERSKPVIQRSNHSSTRSVVTLLLKTNAHENASPNIQP
ncbi:TPX2 (TARGETING PROTEIN FOR XKLP2) PROTEIN FAMILY [Salix koriyanagi]|uniref:TPX2 (TARGETING PROTEIN FOR XKLP2) PROTEIN FAMILY n=1 Tax=Salix koriyanagi TaxID=2511006 RepID=A0A9Q1AFH3_9ROSI|nr:TPX2 (TARGETING PROTEIN FOR XKLP2) PROTEIN FAMILY [Salix koriyanagi]